MKFTCAHCGKTTDRPAGHVSRARAQGFKLYCGRRCSGLGRRKHKTKAQKREGKRIYDAEYRRNNRDLLKAKKAAYFKQTYDPAKAMVERKRRAKAHAEYCRRPEYRRWKQGYDRQHLASKHYGSFAEVALLCRDLNREIKERMTNEQIKRENGTWGKRQARARASAQEATRDRNRAAQR